MTPFIFIRRHLVATANAGKTTTYKDIAALPGVDLNMKRFDHRREIALLLAGISEVEHLHGNPLLTAVVVRTQPPTKRVTHTAYPGEGFYVLARGLGRLTSTDRDEERKFFSSELGKVHAKLWR